MAVETPNVSVTTNDELTPLVDRTPRARVTKPAAWVWAIVMLTCLAGVIFLGVSGNLPQDMGVSGNLQDLGASGNLHQNMGVSGNPQDAAAVYAAGDSSDLGGNWWKKAFKGLQGRVKNLKKAVDDAKKATEDAKKATKDAENEAATQKNRTATLATEVASLKTQLETQTNYAASRANQITDLNKVINAVKNMHKLSDLQNNAIIPAEIKSAVSTMVNSIHGVKRDLVDGDGNVDGDGTAASDLDTDGDSNGDSASGPGPACNDTKADAANKAKEIAQLKHEITDFTHVINTVKNMHYLSDLHRNAIIPAEIKIEVSKMMDSMHDRDPWSQRSWRSPPPAPPPPPSLPECRGVLSLVSSYGRWCADNPDKDCEKYRSDHLLNGLDKITPIDMGGGQIALKGGGSGLYCSDDGYPATAVSCNKHEIKYLEKFKIVNVADWGKSQVALEGARGYWCSDEGYTIKCDKVGLGGVGDKSMFTLVCS
jgi:hypothetical protein